MRASNRSVSAPLGFSPALGISGKASEVEDVLVPLAHIRDGSLESRQWIGDGWKHERLDGMAVLAAKSLNFFSSSRDMGYTTAPAVGWDNGKILLCCVNLAS